ncbi:methyltransferase domain-containing protein [Marinivivus vitaminiproducens]|uniref:class I SAM-dependent methyltransferase n=1 Tax=Marinivivus vitaminiproducens TaxID=3035935 RepID=UPI0027AAEC05|nr:class I SAM-dependent methyltransferase [Geminicoccaceae bacterium SCSIO 64248]
MSAAEPPLRTSVVADHIQRFYDTVGWDEADDGLPEDAKMFVDLRPTSQAYVEAARRRVQRHIPAEGGERYLDAGSGPVQFREYAAYSRNFDKRYCVDFSQAALDSAKRRLGDHGEYVLASLLDLPFPDNHFDCTSSLHVLYHIDAKDQLRAMRELLRVTRPGQPIIIVYGNPNGVNLFTHRNLSRVHRVLRRLQGKPRDPSIVTASGKASPLYAFRYPLRWWRQFETVASVEIHPWRSLTVDDMKLLVPGTPFGERMLAWLFKAEDRLPWLANQLGAYPMIVLKKRG